MSFNYIIKFNFVIFKLVSFSHVAKGGVGVQENFCGNCQYIQLDYSKKSQHPTGWEFLISCTPKDLDPEDGFNKEWPTLELHGILKKSFLNIFEWKISLYWKFQNGK